MSEAESQFAASLRKQLAALDRSIEAAKTEQKRIRRILDAMGEPAPIPRAKRAPRGHLQSSILSTALTNGIVRSQARFGGSLRRLVDAGLLRKNPDGPGSLLTDAGRAVAEGA